MCVGTDLQTGLRLESVRTGMPGKTELGLSNLAVNSQEGSRVLPVTLTLWAHRHEACSRKVGKSARRLEKPPGEKE